MKGKKINPIPGTTITMFLIIVIFLGSILSSSGASRVQIVQAQRGSTTISNDQDWIEYKDPHWGFSIRYPVNWKLQNNPFRDFGFRISSPDLVVDPMGQPTKGAFLAVLVTETTEQEWETFMSEHQDRIEVGGVQGFQTIGFDDEYTFEWVTFTNQHLYSFRFVSASHNNWDDHFLVVQRIIHSLVFAGEYSDYPAPDYTKLLDGLASFPPIKHAFEPGSGKIINGYGEGSHTGGDSYALDICSSSGCIENSIVLAPTDITLIWNNSNGDFHIFQVSEDDNGNKLCMSLGHFYITLPGFIVGKHVPQGAAIGRMSPYRTVPHLHMGIWHHPSYCGDINNRTAIPYTNTYQLDGVDYPAGQNHKTKCIVSTNWPICAAPTGLRLTAAAPSDCIPLLPPLPVKEDAAFVADVTLPDDGPPVSPGQALVKTWRMRNTGNTTWGSGYQLAFVSGEQMGATSPVNVPNTAPNATADISINLTAPINGGVHAGYWRLRNPQGTYFGPLIWVKISVPYGSSPTPPPSGNEIDLTCLDCPSVLAPGQTYRPTIRATVHTGQLLQSRGDMLRNTDGNLYGAWPHVAVVGSVNPGQTYDFIFYANNPLTAPSSEGAYQSKWRIWRNGNWAGPEITIRLDVRNGGGTRPAPPSLVSPGNWYVSRDGSTPALCASAPGGLQYYFQIYESHDIPESGWISSNCWTPPGLGAYGYQWHVKVKDAGTGLESDWSETWHFGIDSQQLSLDDFTFIPSSPSAADEVQVRTCVQGFGGIGNSLQIWANTATDCSENGSWYWIDPKGNFCYDPAKPQEWPQFHTRPLSDGCHLIRAIGFHGDLRTVKETTYTLQRRRPSNVQLINPEQDAWFNTRTITFRWNPEESLRVNSFTFNVSTNSDPLVNPIITQTLIASTREYTYTFDQAYSSLYWRVQACNELGCGDAAIGHFGIDQTNPSSAVNALGPTTFETVFSVSWTGGTDNASGIRWYDVQYRDGDRGSWIDWQTNVSNTVAIFIGQTGHQYYFRARALDNAGNQEDYSTAANGNTFTTVDPAAAPPAPWWNSGYQSKRNILVQNNVGNTMAAGYPVHLHFDSGTIPSSGELYAASQSGIKGDDIRIVYNNTTELSRWIQTFTSSQIDIWFKTQTGIGGNGSDGTSCQLYYGNPSASNPPGDIDNVMPPGKDANTMGLWHLADGTGSTFVDTSGRGHNGNLPNAHGWGNDPFGPYIEWYGGGDGAAWGEVGSSSDFDLSSALTLEAWVYPNYDGSTPEQTIIYRPASSENCAGFRLNVTDRKVDMNVNCGPRDWSGDIAGNRWTHIAGTFDGSALRIYRDGTLIRTEPYAGSIRSMSGRLLYLGGTPWTQTFKGRVRHVRISNVVRSDFSYAANIAAISIAPSLAVGDPIQRPLDGSPDLAVLDLATYSNPGGGVLAQTVIQNQGNLDTLNGFYTDVYLNHLPTGSGYYTGSVHFWVDDPIAAGATVTLTTVITDLTSIVGMSAQPLSVGAEISGTLYAQVDSTGAVSEADNLNNIYSAGTQVCVAGVDAYESDDITGTAQLIAVGQTQTHNFSGPGDRDWVKFVAEAGRTYLISTSNLGTAADTYLYLYDTDGTTLLASNDDYGGSLASQIEWQAPASGTYYVLVQHWNPNVGGCGTSYDLSMTHSFPNHVYLPVVTRDY